MQKDEEVYYFPSRNKPMVHAQPHPISQTLISGRG
jgi:hypothetical protein